MSGDPFCAYYNPAGLAAMDSSAAGLMHAVYFQDIAYEYGVFAAPVEKLGVLAFSVQYLSVGKLAEVDNTGAPTGNSFSPNDAALSAVYAKRLGSFDLGLAVKYIRSQIRESASTFAGDLGARTEIGKYALGLSVLNVGNGLKFRDEESGLPTTIRLGGSVLLRPEWLLSVDVAAPKGTGPLLAAGAEYSLISDPNTSFALRAGYNTRYVPSRLGLLAGMSLGAGLGLGDTSIDYAWSPYGDLGATQRFSIAVKFGVVGAKAAASVPSTENSPVASTRAFRAWLAQLKSPDPKKRRQAAFELGKTRSPEAVAPLLALLEDGDDKVCATTALALGWIGDGRAFKPLLERLNDSTTAVRVSAAKALGYLGDKRAIKPLQTALKYDSPQVQKAAREALKRLGTEKEQVYRQP
jgi:hypothetical protein